MGGTQRQGPPLLTQEEGASWLAEKVAAGTPFAAGKLGTAECEAICFYLSCRRPEISEKKPYPAHILQHMFLNAGLFPATEATLDAYVVYMATTVLPALDGVAEWNPCIPFQEGVLLQNHAPHAVRFPARSLEPYYTAGPENRWSLVATGGSSAASAERPPLAVVSPFAATIGAQWPQQERVWSNGPAIWIPSKLHLVRAGYSPELAGKKVTCSWPRAVQEGGWSTAIRWMADSVQASGAKLAVVGCGALSLPLCIALKSRGISAIHTGGATQILFGVKGCRWETHSVISTFFNDAWVRPSAAEVPTHAGLVEGSCYW